jgi:hypothetical protein
MAAERLRRFVTTTEEGLLSGKNIDEDRNTDLRSKRDAYGAKTATDNAQGLDFAHHMRIANDEIVARKGTK